MDAFVIYDTGDEHYEWECLGVTYSPYGAGMRMDCHECMQLDTNFIDIDNAWFDIDDEYTIVIEYPGT